jgi:hypothetical protein
MAFPSNPTNGQTSTVNGITYTYNLTNNTWTKVSLPVLQISQDPSSAVTRYPLFAANTTGNVSVVNVNSAGLTYVPSTGTLSATNLNIGSTNVLDLMVAYNLAFG